MRDGGIIDDVFIRNECTYISLYFVIGFRGLWYSYWCCFRLLTAFLWLLLEQRQHQVTQSESKSDTNTYIYTHSFHIFVRNAFLLLPNDTRFISLVVILCNSLKTQSRHFLYIYCMIILTHHIKCNSVVENKPIDYIKKVKYIGAVVKQLGAWITTFWNINHLKT